MGDSYCTTTATSTRSLVQPGVADIGQGKNNKCAKILVFSLMTDLKSLLTKKLIILMMKNIFSLDPNLMSFWRVGFCLDFPRPS